jgi:hypothetical protein
MLLDGLDASTVAFEVRESVSHFNHPEYSRYFGQPPMRDIKALREGTTLCPDCHVRSCEGSAVSKSARHDQWFHSRVVSVRNSETTGPAVGFAV